MHTNPQPKKNNQLLRICNMPSGPKATLIQINQVKILSIGEVNLFIGDEKTKFGNFITKGDHEFIAEINGKFHLWNLKDLNEPYKIVNVSTKYSLASVSLFSPAVKISDETPLLGPSEQKMEESNSDETCLQKCGECCSCVDSSLDIIRTLTN